MKRPAFILGTQERRDGNIIGQDPSGFEGAGFQRSQAERIVEFVRVCFEEYIGRSRINEKMASHLPDQLPIYALHDWQEQPFARSTAILKAKTVTEHLRERQAIDVSLDTAFLRTSKMQMQLKDQLMYVFTAIAVNPCTGSPNYSRDTSLISGISGKIQWQSESSFSPDLDSGVITSGLSVPDGIVADFCQSVYPAKILANAVFENVTLDTLWKLCDVLMNIREREDRVPLCEETNDAIRSTIPDHATNILRNPLYRQAVQGSQAIFIRNKANTKILSFPFTVKQRTQALQKDAGEDLGLDVMEFRPRLAVNTLQPFNQRKQPVGRPAPLKLNFGYVFDVEDMDEITKKFGYGDVVKGYRYTLQGVGTLEVPTTIRQQGHDKRRRKS